MSGVKSYGRHHLRPMSLLQYSALPGKNTKKTPLWGIHLQENTDYALLSLYVTLNKTFGLYTSIYAHFWNTKIDDDFMYNRKHAAF